MSLDERGDNGQPYLNWTKNDNGCDNDGPFGQMQSIYELDADCNVIFQGRIGQGFYGEVFLGTLEREGNRDPKQVAVKKLKVNAIEAGVKDFEREIDIMKVIFLIKYVL